MMISRKAQSPITVIMKKHSTSAAMSTNQVTVGKDTTCRKGYNHSNNNNNGTSDLDIDHENTTNEYYNGDTSNVPQSERRSLLPPVSSSSTVFESDGLDRTAARGSFPSRGSSNHNNNNNNHRASRNSKRRKSQQSPPISIRRKMHDLRLRSILNATDDDDDNDDNVRLYGGVGGSSSRGTQRTTNSRDDWIRPYWLGLGLFLILYSFWILDTLKDPIFGALLPGGLHYNLPRAKLFSVATTLFLVVLLEYIAKEQKKATRLRQRQDQQQQVDHLRTTDDSEYDFSNAVRSHEDVLDGGGTWNRMKVGTSISYNSDSANHHADSNGSIHQQQQRSQIFITIGVPFCIFFAMCAYFLQFNPNTAWTGGRSITPTGTSSSSSNNIAEEMDQSTQQAWRVLGYCIYAAVESFGSLMVATFWSYTNSTLTLQDAETYYGTIIAFAQLGAIAGSTMVTIHVWNSITLFIVACLVILLHIIVMVTYNRRFPPTRPINYDDEDIPTTTRTTVPSHLKQDASNKNDDTKSIDDDDEPIVQLSGVRLILKHNYVCLILGVSCLYEVSLTCLNYQMTLLGWSKFEESNMGSSASAAGSNNSFIDVMSFTQFMGHYGQMVNVSSLLLSSFIFPTLIYRVGLKYTLRLFPTLLLLVNIIAFIAMPGNLLVLFFSMSLLKATTYSIHDPAKEILYIPTSNAIQFNAKFWIDVVGARVAKAIGSSINHFSGSVHRSIRVASAPSLITAMGLWYVCYCIGTQFDSLIATNTIVGVDDDSDDAYTNDGDRNYRSKINQTEYSEEHDEDGDGRGTVEETKTSYELTAL